jgi:hypothetical protein
MSSGSCLRDRLRISPVWQIEIDGQSAMPKKSKPKPKVSKKTAEADWKETIKKAILKKFPDTSGL